jgi:hypothetical protein
MRHRLRGWLRRRSELRRVRLARLTKPRILDASLHVDGDAICPDCLTWIDPTDYVRRNAFGIVEHEVCPPTSVRR